VRSAAALNQTFRDFVPPQIAVGPPQVSAPDAPVIQLPGESAGQGTYSPELPYGSQPGTQTERLLVGHRTAATGIETLIHGPNLWKSAAGAVLLVLVAAHLLAWLRHQPEID